MCGYVTKFTYVVVDGADVSDIMLSFTNLREFHVMSFQVKTTPSVFLQHIGGHLDHLVLSWLGKNDTNTLIHAFDSVQKLTIMECLFAPLPIPYPITELSIRSTLMEITPDIFPRFQYKDAVPRLTVSILRVPSKGRNSGAGFLDMVLRAVVSKPHHLCYDHIQGGIDISSSHGKSHVHEELRRCRADERTSPTELSNCSQLLSISLRCCETDDAPVQWPKVVAFLQ